MVILGSGVIALEMAQCFSAFGSHVTLVGDCDSWKLSDFVTPAVMYMYTEPEYYAAVEHNDRAILESDNVGFCMLACKAATDKILGAAIVP